MQTADATLRSHVITLYSPLILSVSMFLLGGVRKGCLGFGPFDSTNLPPKSTSLPSRSPFFSKLLRKTLRLANHSFFGFGFQGGAGGKGNVSFKSSTCQTPQVAEAGGVGEEFTFDIGNVDDRQAVPKINIGIRTETELGRGSKAQA